LEVINTNPAGIGSFAAAIATANGNRSLSNTIVFDAPLAAQTITISSELVITKSVLIDASDAPGLILDGDNTSTIFAISSAHTVYFSVLNLKIQNGFSIANGGAVDAESTSRITLENDTFSDNYALENGGAIAMTAAYSSLVLQNCMFTGNTVGAVNQPVIASGGAIAILGSNSRLNISQSRFSDNTAIGGNAGGVNGSALGGAISMSGASDALQISQQSRFFANQAMGTTLVGGARAGMAFGGAISITGAGSVANSIVGRPRSVAGVCTHTPANRQ